MGVAVDRLLASDWCSFLASFVLELTLLLFSFFAGAYLDS